MFPSLNLLPPERKKEIQRTGILLLVHEIILFVFIAVIFGSSLLLGARLILEQRFREIVIENVPGATKITYLNRDVLNLNKRLGTLEEISSKSPFWSDLMLEIVTHTPPQINYKSLNLLDTSINLLDTRTINLSGTAQTRDALINFKKELESSAYIAKVDLPLQYLVKTQDIDFTLDLIINLP